MVCILIERTARSLWPLGKVAAIVCVINAGGAEWNAAFSAIQRHARMTMSFERQGAMGTAKRLVRNGFGASRANGHGVSIADSLDVITIIVNASVD
jgi:hypothetical protein